MNRLFLLAGAASLSFVPATGSACSCSPDEHSVAQDLAQADAVFAGQAIELLLVDPKGADVLSQRSDDVGDEDVKVRFRVTKSWKGGTTRDIVVLTALMGTACGYHFNIGQEYLVWANRHPTDQSLRTSVCSRTKPLHEAADQLTELGPPKETFE